MRSTSRTKPSSGSTSTTARWALKANDRWAFSPRYEYYNDADAFTTGLDQKLQEITLTGEYKTPVGLLARFEFRSDFSNKEFFVKDSGATTKTQPWVSVSLIYAFSSKQ